MQNTKQKKKVSYDDILASLKMSLTSNGKLEIVRTDAAAAAEETKLKDQLVQKYLKPKIPNNSKQNQSQQKNSKQFKPVTRMPIKPIPPSFIQQIKSEQPPKSAQTKSNYLASYYNVKDTIKPIEGEGEVGEGVGKIESVNEIKLNIEEIKLTDAEKQEQIEYNRHQQEYNRAIFLQKINEYNERVWIRQTKTKKMLFATSNLQISPIPLNKLFSLK